MSELQPHNRSSSCVPDCQASNEAEDLPDFSRVVAQTLSEWETSLPYCAPGSDSDDTHALSKPAADIYNNSAERNLENSQESLTRQSSYTSGTSPISFRSATSMDNLNESSHISSPAQYNCSDSTTQELVITPGTPEQQGDLQRIEHMLHSSLCDLTLSFHNESTKLQPKQHDAAQTLQSNSCSDPSIDFSAYVSTKQAASAPCAIEHGVQDSADVTVCGERQRPPYSTPTTQFPSPLSSVALDDLVGDKLPTRVVQKINPFPSFFQSSPSSHTAPTVQDLLISPEVTDAVQRIQESVSTHEKMSQESSACRLRLMDSTVHDDACSDAGSSETVISSSPQAEAVLSFFHAPSTEPLNTIVEEASRLGHHPDPPRPTANVPQEQLEHLEKTSIYVIYQGTCTPVSWFSDTNTKDIREMILCGCDAIVDTGFVLREVHPIPDDQPYSKQRDVSDATSTEQVDASSIFKMQLEGYHDVFRYTLGRRYEFEDFHKLKSGGIYTLQPATERLDLRTITGDRWRRFKLRINPLLHVESMKAIEIMRRGTNLLRHTQQGFPHLRQFQLSSDCRRLLWYSAPEGGTTAVWIHAIREITLGQKSALFQRYKLPALEHLSFTIYYDGFDSASPFKRSVSKLLPFFTDRQPWLQSLDLTCKDETEFDHWVCGLKALAFHANRMKLSKEELLSHCRKFRKAVEAVHPTLRFPNLPGTNAPGTLGLEECLELPLHNAFDLQTKYERLVLSVARVEKKINDFDKTYAHTYLESSDSVTFVTSPTTVTDNAAAASTLPVLPSSSSSLPMDLMYPVSPTSNDFLSSSTLNSHIRPTVLDNNDLFLFTSASAKPDVAAFTDVSTDEDDRLEYLRMRELIVSVGTMLEDSRKALTQASTQGDVEKTAGNSTVDMSSDDAKTLRNVNQLLWKAEVDLENVDDMLRRLIARRTENSPLIAQLLKKNLGELNINQELQKFGEQVCLLSRVRISS